jgi:hypothetical protein
MRGGVTLKVVSDWPGGEPDRTIQEVLEIVPINGFTCSDIRLDTENHTLPQ